MCASARPLPARGVAEVTIDDPDGFQGDNARYWLLEPPRPVTVLVLTAEPPESATTGLYVQRALEAAAETWPMRVVVEDGRRYSSAAPRRGARCRSSSSARGRSIAAAASAWWPTCATADACCCRSGPTSTCPTLGDALGVAIRLLPDPVVPPPDEAAIIPSDRRHPVWRQLAGSRSALGRLPIDRYRQVLDDTDWDVLARFAGGAVAFAERHVAQGTLLLFASDLDNRWNRFPLEPGFAPFIAETAQLSHARRADDDGVRPARRAGGRAGGTGRACAAGRTRPAGRHRRRERRPRRERSDSDHGRGVHEAACRPPPSPRRRRPTDEARAREARAAAVADRAARDAGDARRREPGRTRDAAPPRRSRPVRIERRESSESSWPTSSRRSGQSSTTSRAGGRRWRGVVAGPRARSWRPPPWPRRGSACCLLAPTGGAFVALVALAGAGRRGRPDGGPRRAARVSSTPVQLARLLEERLGGLDDVVVTAVDYAARTDHAPAMADRLAAAALRAVGTDGAEAVVPSPLLQASGRRALAAGLALAAALVVMTGPFRDAVDVAGAYLMPSRLTIAVEPGNVRVRAGRAVTIRARVSGSAALAPSLVAGDGADVVPMAMTATADGAFEAVVPDVTASFPYHVVAGARRSDAYTVTVVHPARVERIDLDYAYPPALGLEPRREEDGGDIYAPEGTAVTLRDHGRPAGERQRARARRWPPPAARRRRQRCPRDSSPSRPTARIASPSSTTTASRCPTTPSTSSARCSTGRPTCGCVRPAGDKQVTPLEEVLIEARADDDFGVRSFDLVLQKPGDAEVVVPLQGTRVGADGQRRAHALSRGSRGRAGRHRELLRAGARHRPRQAVVGVAQRHLLPRGEGVQRRVRGRAEPGDGRRRAGAGRAGPGRGAEGDRRRDLEARQPRQARQPRRLGAGHQGHRRCAARARAAGGQGGRQPDAGRRAAPAGRRAGGAGAPPLDSVGDDPMGLAIEAMRRADRGARRAADRRRPAARDGGAQPAAARRVRRAAPPGRPPAGGAAGGGNRETPDLSALFDQELRKQQQTNYETPASSETRRRHAPGRRSARASAGAGAPAGSARAASSRIWPATSRTSTPRR